jgi:hypothetical protein
MGIHIPDQRVRQPFMDTPFQTMALLSAVSTWR